ncbi:MAG: hypothetical protein AAFX08_09200 [Pseudomonadota bacterium]
MSEETEAGDLNGASAEGARFQELKSAIREYGAAAFQNLVKCRALARAIIEGFADYEGCPRASVRAVPPMGEFDPHKDYGDAAFSYAARPVIVLEPIRFGLSLIVGNAEDAGALWLRTSIAVEMTADAFDIYVAARPRVRAPLSFEGELNPVFERIHREFLETFTREINEFNDVRFSQGIGFLPV